MIPGNHRRRCRTAWSRLSRELALIMILIGLQGTAIARAQTPPDQGGPSPADLHTEEQPAPQSALQPKEPIADPVLRMEVGTHSSHVRNIAIDPSNRFLVTASEDKTVRVWDTSAGGAPVRIFRPPVGGQGEGRAFAAALSPDGETVACGGQTGWQWDGSACVYLFDRVTGSLVKRLTGLPGSVSHLAYTSDGRLLTVAMWKRGVRVYRLPEYLFIAEDRDYGGTAMRAMFDAAGSRLATTCFDGFVRLYDLSDLMRQDVSSPRSITPVSKIRPPGGQRHGG
jgi:WD40 repeat protein